jgi:hypothetical protein
VNRPPMKRAMLLAIAVVLGVVSAKRGSAFLGCAGRHYGNRPPLESFERSPIVLDDPAGGFHVVARFQGLGSS